MRIDLTLGSLFAMADGNPYVVTTTFDGRDLINGGMHLAVDVGNRSLNDPITAPADLPARGRYNFDSAIGCEYDLGDGWTLALWHLNATLSPLQMIRGQSAVGPWQNVVKGEITGRTGNSGALVNGQPMPAHTHIRMEHNGVPVDPEPYLLGQPFGEDDMNLPPSFEAVMEGSLPAGTRVRSKPVVEDNVIETLLVPGRLVILGRVFGQGTYTLPDGTQGRDWFVTAIGPGSGEVGFVAEPIWSDIRLTEVGSRLTPATGITQAQLEAARVAGFVDGKSKARIAVEAIKP